MKTTNPNARRRWAVTVALAAAGLALTGCGLQPAASYVPEAEPGSIQPVPNLPEDAEITITSKNFTEQLILGKIAVLAADAAGFEVNDLTNVPGSQPARELIASGQADMLWEYKGTAWLTYLGQDAGIPDQQEQWQAVRDMDLENGLTWAPAAPLNNTYAFAVRSEAVEEFGGISKLSEIADLPVEDRTFCVEAEFDSRPDGMNPMVETYGMERGAADGVPDGNIGIYDTGAVYSATDNGDCNFVEVFTTDGRIDSLGLVVLEDDQTFFPAYNVAAVFFTETLKEYPQLEDVYGQISPLLNDEEMRRMNLEVDVNGAEPADVAFEWMVSEGLITEPA
ncbi:glycine betaine ABC transporter substrate-binding protein [Arthrobacter sp. KK5.5]|uniref:glycine betaine ABC transporter substrate-binding protein n=1 Tax=Arthrobacter sp. KK5.5 TaxID=3373084 RepID=UPI003EE4A097